ncbi:MAG: ATP-binding protein [Candidatus Promineifilaceae bacterium]
MTKIMAIDFGEHWNAVRKYRRNNADCSLRELVGVFPARVREAVSDSEYTLPIGAITFRPIRIPTNQGVQLGGSIATQPTMGDLRGQLDTIFAEETEAALGGEAAETFPIEMADSTAVRTAYRHELDQIAQFLRNGLSVLVVCDKILTTYLHEYVCQRAGKKPRLDSEMPKQTGMRGQLDQTMQAMPPSLDATIPLLLRDLKPNDVLVLQSVDLLDTPPLIETLYQATAGPHKPQLLGFLDPTLEVKPVLLNRFAVHIKLVGLPRYIWPDPKAAGVHTVSQLITQAEQRRFAAFDAEELYKNVSGLNPIQFRDAMRYVGATMVEESDPREVYKRIRMFKTSRSEQIDIPDTKFADIGGYERVKQKLQRIIKLVDGRVDGISDREREKLIPRGFIFHGPPGTGKTLFAKAIANEMNATIQLVSGPEVMDKYVGQSESNLRQIFATARRNAPSIILFDEFDSLASQRGAHGDGGTRANNAVVAQLLTELDGFRRDQLVLVIGTTNRLDIIDEALLRPSRLKPIEIRLPDIVARREVARIHAESFKVNDILCKLFQLAVAHLPAWERDRSVVPQPFLDALFAEHKPFRPKFEHETKLIGFQRELRELLAFVQQVGLVEDTVVMTDEFRPIRTQLVELGKRYGVDLLQSGAGSAEQNTSPMAQEILNLFQLVQTQTEQSDSSASKAYLSSVLVLIAEYTEGFNNDEIRAIFQEASLEYHLEGQLITPRYLGMKIGTIRKRRDEREVVHLDAGRGRR